MPLLAVLLLVVAGCGRAHFTELADATACANATGHDEDGDGIDDACDPCPHLAGDDADRDGDGVGDACDPNPQIATERIVMFDPFVTAQEGWDPDGGARIEDDALVLTGDVSPRQYASYTRSIDDLGTDLLLVGGTITSNDGPAPHHTLIEIGNDLVEGQLFYCELIELPTTGGLRFTYTLDSVNYELVQTDAAAQPVTGGEGTLAMRVSDQDVQCVSTWRGEALAVEGARPTITKTRLILATQNQAARLAYVIQIRTE